jgi:tetratricopeptide (TPR) repeat protein
MQDLVRTALDLKRRSRKARDAGRLEEAAAALTEAIDALESALTESRNVSAEKEEVLAPESSEVREIATDLADCLGSLGGIRRRQGDIAAAMKLYERGKKVEQNDRYRIANSYNQVQWLVLRILDNPHLLKDGDPETIAEIGRAIETVRRQIATTRREDPWAHSDLGLLKALQGDERGALQAWGEMDSLNPVSSVYSSGMPILEGLAEKLPDNNALQVGLRRFAAAIPSR